MFIIVFILFLSSLTDLPDGVIFCIFAIFSRLLLATVISVPLGGIITGLYFIIYSLFGKFLYKRTNTDIALNLFLIACIGFALMSSNAMPIIIIALLIVSLFTAFKPPADIEEYISNQRAEFEDAQFCNANTFANWGYDMLRQIIIVVEFIRTYLIRIVLFVLAIYSIILLFDMHNSDSQTRLYGVFLVFVLFMLKISWPLIKSAVNGIGDFFNKNKQDTHDVEPASETPTPAPETPTPTPAPETPTPETPTPTPEIPATPPAPPAVALLQVRNIDSSNINNILPPAQ
jgi:hypothetical protein